MQDCLSFPLVFWGLFSIYPFTKASSFMWNLNFSFSPWRTITPKFLSFGDHQISPGSPSSVCRLYSGFSFHFIFGPWDSLFLLLSPVGHLKGCELYSYCISRCFTAGGFRVMQSITLLEIEIPLALWDPCKTTPPSCATYRELPLLLLSPREVLTRCLLELITWVAYQESTAESDGHVLYG